MLYGNMIVISSYVSLALFRDYEVYALCFMGSVETWRSGKMVLFQKEMDNLDHAMIENGRIGPEGFSMTTHLHIRLIYCRVHCRTRCTLQTTYCRVFEEVANGSIEITLRKPTFWQGRLYCILEGLC